MSERNPEQKEQAWADQIPEEDAVADNEKTYRDGSAVHECWNEKQENV